LPPKTNFREDLAISLGHQPEHYDFRRLEILIRRLRNKAKEAWSDILPLETAHRQGYAFTANIRIGMAWRHALVAEPRQAAMQCQGQMATRKRMQTWAGP
jgi:hypothetical protein